MNPKFIQAHEYIAKAREALHRGDKGSARQLGERAALLVPGMEDAWLVLAASDPNPRDALAYAQKALEINPQSRRAHRGVEWAKLVVSSFINWSCEHHRWLRGVLHVYQFCIRNYCEQYQRACV